MGLTPERRAAAEILSAVARGRRLDLALEASVRGLTPSQRRFAHELTYGVTRLRGRLDHLLALASDRDLGSLEGGVLTALRMGAYQTLHMAGTPAYAAVSQAVSQVRSVGGGRAAGFVNAVLRAVAEVGEADELFPSFARDPAGFLTTWGSHPRWLVNRWLARWPPVEVRTLVEANNRIPPLTVVPLETDVPQAEATLRAAGIEARRAGRGAPALVLSDRGLDRVLDSLVVVVQDPAAALVARYADAAPGSRVADVCAAPGGKALYMARTAAYVVAADPSEARLRLLRENVRRTGSSVGIIRARAEAPPFRDLDLVLVDAPCTGTGTLRRHPDARWRLRSTDPGRMAQIQARILHGASEAVRPGGVLVYGTCSLEPEENEGVVESFLAHERDFVAEAGCVPVLADVDERGRLCVLPQRTGFDGAWAVRLRRAG